VVPQELRDGRLGLARVAAGGGEGGGAGGWGGGRAAPRDSESKAE
jgi:hypothetical protein